jgi:type VI secretion system secreted protein VgrG
MEKNMNVRWIYALLLCSLSALSLNAGPITLGNADSYAVLAGSAITNTGATVISGNLGLSPGSAITGFPPGIVNGTIHSADAHASAAQADALTAYNALAGYAVTQNLTGQNLGGLTLTPGVYKFDSSAGLTGALTLDLLGNTDSLFIFQIGSTLTTASNSSVIMSDGAGCCNVFWQIGSSATLGTNTDFVGNILALTSITLTTGAGIVDGRALALNGAVTLDTNNISGVDCSYITPPTPPDTPDTPNTPNTPDTPNITDTTAVPEPGSVLLLGAGLFGLVLLGRKSRRGAA